MAKIAILTPDPRDEGDNKRWAQVLERNAEPLRRAGFEVEPCSWTDDAALERFDLVLPLLAWGYPQAHDEWVRRVSDWERRGINIHNPAPVLRWNSDKSYLGRLAERGAPVVPTFYSDKLSAAALTDAAAQFGCERLVAKPRISAGGWRTIRWSPGQPFRGGPEGPAMIQPYLPEIEQSGEVSLIFFGGHFSHAIAKRPQPGEFRVQPEYDGIISRHDPAPDELEASRAILGHIEEALLYARIDLVRGLDGAPALIEIELIEPDLYLGYDPGNGALFAEAVAELLAR